ncbi:hypothetical protein [Microbacterium sp. A93]|uniref:hypothetical protein n=1 Tax=Microbacterium sp. A93 TaxID=3450716 RepID=UPI003F42D28C
MQTSACETCGAPSTSRFCTEAHRLKEWRARQAHHRELTDKLLAQRRRLAREADAALADGSIDKLTAVARRAASLLAA